MKKLLGSTLALAMFLPAGANAELLKNFKASGAIDVNAVSANNVGDLSTQKYDKIDTVQTRVLVNGDWDLLDDVHSKATLNKNNRVYGSGSESILTVQTVTTFVQANVKIDKLFGAIDTTLGRQFYGDAGDMVIYFGPRNDYGLTVTALDGARFDWNGETAGATVLGAKLVSASAALTPKDTGDQNLWGVDVHAKPSDNVNGGAYLYYKRTVRSGTGTAPGIGVAGDDKLFVAGVKGKATMGGAWIKGEIAKNFGSNRTFDATTGGQTFAGNYTGWAARVNGGVKADVNDVGALTGWGEAGIGSGGATSNRSFQAIAGDYRPGGIAGRFWSGNGVTGAGLGGGITGLGTGATVDQGTLSNRVNIGAGVKVTPSALSKLTAGLAWWNYRAQSAASVPAASAGNKFLGNEYDLDLTWAHSENVSVSAGVGDFQPGRAYIAAASAVPQGVSPARMAYADFNVKF